MPLINSMEQSPSSKANSHTVSQEITRLLSNTKFHYRVYNILPMVLILSQINLVHTHSFTKLQSNIILPSMSSLPRGLFRSGFPTKILYTFLIFPIHATCPAHLILTDLIALIIFGEVYKS